jgi:hypothetical protein
MTDTRSDWGDDTLDDDDTGCACCGFACCGFAECECVFEVVSYKTGVTNAGSEETATQLVCLTHEEAP